MRRMGSLLTTIRRLLCGVLGGSQLAEAVPKRVCGKVATLSFLSISLQRLVAVMRVPLLLLVGLLGCSQQSGEI
jgi:hypothetical protein